MNQDVAKDSSMECTVISLTLDLVADICRKKRVAVPRTLIISADNTTREANHQMLLSYLAWLKGTRRFDVVQCEYTRTGHAHNEQDTADGA